MHRELLTNTISSAEAAADHVGSTAALTQLQLKRINFNLTVLCIQTKFHHLHTERRWKITPVIIRHSARLDIPLHLQILNHITAGKAARLRGQLYDNTSAAGRGKKKIAENIIPSDTTASQHCGTTTALPIPDTKHSSSPWDQFSAHWCTILNYSVHN